MSSFRDLLHCNNNEEGTPTLERMKEMITFHQDKKLDMLKLGCSLPNLANICLHKATDTKFYFFTEADRDLSEKF